MQGIRFTKRLAAGLALAVNAVGRGKVEAIDIAHGFKKEFQPFHIDLMRLPRVLKDCINIVLGSAVKNC